MVAGDPPLSIIRIGENARPDSMSVSSVDVDVTEEESSELAFSSGTSETSTQEVGQRLRGLVSALS